MAHCYLFFTYNSLSNLQLKLVIIKYNCFFNLVAAIVSVPAVVLDLSEIDKGWTILNKSTDCVQILSIITLS